MTDRDKIEQEAEARIVAWLRAEVDANRKLVRDARKLGMFGVAGQSASDAVALHMAADAIARREHLPADLEGDK